MTARISRVETSVQTLEKTLLERLGSIEGEVSKLRDVVAATADDTLRVCLLLEELSKIGVLPVIPWRLATALVETHHAQFAKNQGETTEDGSSLDSRLAQLSSEVRQLREEFAVSYSTYHQPGCSVVHDTAKNEPSGGVQRPGNSHQ